MVNSNDAQAFLNKLETDADFRNAITAATHPAGKVQIVKDAGFSFTPDELNEALSDPGTSERVREMAAAAVSNITPKGLEPDYVGFWLFWF